MNTRNGFGSTRKLIALEDAISTDDVSGDPRYYLQLDLPIMISPGGDRLLFSRRCPFQARAHVTARGRTGPGVLAQRHRTGRLITAGSFGWQGDSAHRI